MDNSVERDKRIEEIRRMNSRLISSHHAQDFLLKELDRLQVERDKAIAALDFYANEENWRQKYQPEGLVCIKSKMDDDYGRVARLALEIGVPHDPLD